MFKKGDIVVCIDANDTNNQLKYLNKYVVNSCTNTENIFSIKTNYKSIVVIEGISVAFVGDRFKLLSEIRFEKLEKIKNEFHR